MPPKTSSNLRLQNCQKKKEKKAQQRSWNQLMFAVFWEKKTNNKQIIKTAFHFPSISSLFQFYSEKTQHLINALILQILAEKQIVAAEAN